MTRRSRLCLSLGIALSFWTCSAFALSPKDYRPKRVQAYAEALHGVVDYRDAGSVEEEIARQELLREFPEDRFEILRGVEYYIGSRLVGELDIVVFERVSQRVVMIAEVKSYGGRKAINRATEQRQRFQAALREREITLINLRHNKSRVFKPWQFQSRWHYRMIGLAGFEGSRFDQFLAITRNELDWLYEILRKPKTFRRTFQNQMQTGQRPGCDLLFGT